MSSRICATGHIKDPVPLIEKSRTSCSGSSFPHSSHTEDGLRCCEGITPPLTLSLISSAQNVLEEERADVAMLLTETLIRELSEVFLDTCLIKRDLGIFVLCTLCYALLNFVIKFTPQMVCVFRIWRPMSRSFLIFLQDYCYSLCLQYRTKASTNLSNFQQTNFCSHERRQLSQLKKTPPFGFQEAIL